MEFYTYYLRRLENRPDQQTAMYSCRDMAMRLFDTGPLTWSIASGAALLCALHEAKFRPGVDVLPVFREIEQALFNEIQGMHLDLQADQEQKNRSAGYGQPKQPRHRRSN